MKKERLQRGQAMVLLALAFVGLAAFIGLTVDAGILFIQVGHLRRAVDSSSLAAANQFREGRNTADIEAAANEFINLNSLNPADADVFICDLIDPGSVYHDPTLCPDPGDPPRKFVRVRAQMPVNFVFLTIIGWHGITIHADTISETASVDIVLAIDTSPSMTFDAACDDGDDDDGDGWDDECEDYDGDGCLPTEPCDTGTEAQEDWGPNGVPDDLFSDPATCNGPPRECHPFEEVRDAALALVNRMYFPYDRMAVVTFDRTAQVQVNLTSNKADVVNAVNALEVALYPDPSECDLLVGGDDARGCTSTNIAGGLRLAGNEFGLSTREEAVWIVIVLSDGSANAAQTADVPPKWICPGSPGAPTWVAPLCRDTQFEKGLGASGYDPEDAAEDEALFVGCPDALSPQPAGCPNPGQGAVIFTIGLGDDVTNSTTCAIPPYASCEPDQGEKILRFIAGVGDDNDPDTPPAIDPCEGVTTGQSCGNYYYSPTGSGLLQVFEAIASRIFTRITH
ncbi:MAG: VWA domain-containing protein [Anaerolineales bacterium]|nr:VWA domain-containing protein [Anaerolineales bacterium]